LTQKNKQTLPKNPSNILLEEIRAKMEREHHSHIKMLCPKLPPQQNMPKKIFKW